MTRIIVHPESTHGAAPGFTCVEIDGRDHLTLTDFPVYRELADAEAKIAAAVEALGRYGEALECCGTCAGGVLGDISEALTGER